MKVQFALLSSLAFLNVAQAGQFDLQTAPAQTAPLARPGKFQKLNSALQYARSGHSLEVLNDGRLLIAGGAWGDLGGENRAEIVDSRKLNGRSVALKMSELRSQAVHAKLPDGRILFMGGAADFEPALGSTDFFDPSRNTFTAGPNMTIERVGHAGVSLPDGRVIVFGGSDGNLLHDTVEVFDPKTGEFQQITARLSVARASHTATLVNPQTIVLMGGETGPTEADPERPSEFLDSIEIFDVPSMSFIPTQMKMNTARLYHSAVRLDDNRVVVSGGLSAPAQSSISIDVLDLKERSLVEAGYFLHGRSSHSMTLLPDGSLLVAGGVENGQPLSSSERCRFLSASEVHCDEAPVMSRARWNHTATLLKDGRVLFIGGLSNTPEPGRRGGGPIAGLEVFVP